MMTNSKDQCLAPGARRLELPRPPSSRFEGPLLLDKAFGAQPEDAEAF